MLYKCTYKCNIVCKLDQTQGGKHEHSKTLPDNDNIQHKLQ